jgi:hypothetical protein
MSVVTRNPPQQKLTPSTIGIAVNGGVTHRLRPGGSTTRPWSGSTVAAVSRKAFQRSTVACSDAAGTPMASASPPRVAACTAGSGICPIRPAFSRATTSSTTYHARRPGWACSRSTRSS